MKTQLLLFALITVSLSACGGGGHGHQSSSSSGDDGGGDTGIDDGGGDDGGTIIGDDGGDVNVDPTTGDVFGCEKTVEVSKDVEKVGAVVEKAQSRQVGERLAANYGLSEQRGVELAEMILARKELHKTRAFTAADTDRFAMALSGSTAAELQSAYQSYTNGQNGNYDAILEKAASVNGTTPENVREIMTRILSQ